MCVIGTILHVCDLFIAYYILLPSVSILTQSLNYSYFFKKKSNCNQITEELAHDRYLCVKKKKNLTVTVFEWLKKN